ncbi:MAG: hypothetical protein WA432_02280 [Candidatus Babeliaceae bacterium]
MSFKVSLLLASVLCCTASIRGMNPAQPCSKDPNPLTKQCPCPCQNEVCTSTCCDSKVVNQEMVNAIARNDGEVIKSLLKVHSGLINRVIHENMTPIGVALMCLAQGFDTRAVIRLLLECGADTSCMVFTHEGRDYNMPESIQHLLNEIERTQAYLVQLKAYVQEVAQWV